MAVAEAERQCVGRKGGAGRDDFVLGERSWTLSMIRQTHVRLSTTRHVSLTGGQGLFFLNEQNMSI